MDPQSPPPAGLLPSMNDPMPPDPAQYPEDDPREINRHALTGPWDSLFVALLKERCQWDGFGEKDLEDQSCAHINRGVLILYKRVRDLSDLARLIPHKSIIHQLTPG